MSRRPTPEQLQIYRARTSSFSVELGLAAKLSEGSNLGRQLRGVDYAGWFLGEILREGGINEDTIQEYQFTFGRVCLGREPWEAFDKILPKAEKLVADFQARKSWGDPSVSQTPPEPTELLKHWHEDAERFRGDKGVFPQVCHWRGPSQEQYNIEALALSGAQVHRRVEELLKTGEVVELCMGVDMTSLPDQGLKYNDFLLVIWYVGGQFYTGVVDYQLPGAVSEGETPDFGSIRWDCNYWNRVCSEDWLPALRKALPAAT